MFDLEGFVLHGILVIISVFVVFMAVLLGDAVVNGAHEVNSVCVRCKTEWTEIVHTGEHPVCHVCGLEAGNGNL